MFLYADRIGLAPATYLDFQNRVKIDAFLVEYLSTTLVTKIPYLTDKDRERSAVKQATVAIVRNDSQPSDDELESMVRKAVGLAGGLEGIVKNGDHVVIKPNIVHTYQPSSKGVVTDVRVVKTLVKMVKEAGAGAVCIAEGSDMSTSETFHDSGYDVDGDGRFDYDQSVKLVDLNFSGGTDVKDPKYVTEVTLKSGLMRNKYWVPNIILNCDVLISAAVLKNHFGTGITGALKNRAIGCAPADIYHGPGGVCGKGGLTHSTPELDKHIVDLNLCRRIDLALIDGLTGMVNGPVAETPKLIEPPPNLIMASLDPVAIDTVATCVMGYDPKCIHHLRYAEEMGLGVANTANITVVGDSVQNVRMSFPAPYGETGATAAETTSPQIRIDSLAEGSEVSGTLSVAVTDTDDVKVSKMEFYVDGVLQSTRTSPPFGFFWDTTKCRNGAHEVKITAYDAVFNEGNDMRNVNVSNNVGQIQVLVYSREGPDVIETIAGFLNTESDIAAVYSFKESDLEAGSLCAYDVLIDYTHREISAPCEKNIADFVEGGKGFIGLHHSLFNQGKPGTNPYIEKILGGTFTAVSTYPSTFTVHVEDPDHPITAGEEDFLVEGEENYDPVEIFEGTHILFSNNLNAQKNSGWVNEYGSGRAFYFEPGHIQATFRIPNVQRIIAKAVRWCAKRI